MSSILSFKELLNLFEQYVSNHTLSKEPKLLYEPIHYILQIGGKRVRPVALLMGYQLFDKPAEDVLSLAMAIELFHNFSLIHDDMMDNSEMRRGQPSVHIKYGQNAGILSGDMALVEAYQYLCHSQHWRLPSLLSTFNDMAREVCEGQQMDIDFEEDLYIEEEDYLEMIRRKTAVLLGASFEMGAIAAGASEDECTALRHFGIYTGLAFQLMDDYLDSFGNTSLTGKKSGGDILQRKKNYLYIYTLKNSKGRDKDEFFYLYNKEGKSDEEIASICAMMQRTRAEEALLIRAREYDDKATHALPASLLSKAGYGPILDLRNMLATRTF